MLRAAGAGRSVLSLRSLSRHGRAPRTEFVHPVFARFSSERTGWMRVMTGKRKPSPDEVPSTLRLLESVVLEDFDYFNPRKENAMNESLERWPLLRVVCDAMTMERRRRRATADPLGSPTTVIGDTEEVERPLASGGDG